MPFPSESQIKPAGALLLISWKICLVRVFGQGPERMGAATAVGFRQGVHLWEVQTFLILLRQTARCHQMVPDHRELSRLTVQLKTTKPQVCLPPPEMPGTSLSPCLAVLITE